jgi:hypothetical protein
MIKISILAVSPFAAASFSLDELFAGFIDSFHESEVVDLSEGELSCWT